VQVYPLKKLADSESGLGTSFDIVDTGVGQSTTTMTTLVVPQTVFNIQQSGAGSVAGQTVNVSSMVINAQQFDRLPDEYARGLKDFTAELNRLFAEYKVPADKVGTVQTAVQDFAKDVERIPPQTKPTFAQQTGLKAKLAAVFEGVLAAVPAAAQIAASVLVPPLAPFNGLIGSTVAEVVKAVKGES
jgi:hypothetical protein